MVPGGQGEQVSGPRLPKRFGHRLFEVETVSHTCEVPIAGVSRPPVP
jgi:hypothetical protein